MYVSNRYYAIKTYLVYNVCHGSNLVVDQMAVLFSYFFWPVAIAEKQHPIPYRTRQLRSLAPMVLQLRLWESRSLPAFYFQADTYILYLSAFFVPIRVELRHVVHSLECRILDK